LPGAPCGACPASFAGYYQSNNAVLNSLNRPKKKPILLSSCKEFNGMCILASIIPGCFFVFILIVSLGMGNGESAPVDLTSLSLEELMKINVLDMPVSSVSKKTRRLGEAPVAVITQDDIHRSGPRTFPEHSILTFVIINPVKIC
jgi:hypothetical protein